MNLIKKVIFILSVLFLFSAKTFSESVDVKNKNFDAKILYNKFSLPGDAVFVRIVLKTNDNYLKESLISTKGFMRIYNCDSSKFVKNDSSIKSLGKADFYKIPNKKASGIFDKSQSKKMESILAGVPLSSYLKAGNYTIFINFDAFGFAEQEIVLPLVINEKEFVSETIKLNASNTAIRTNGSDKRMQQIKKLNAIFEAKNYDAVYELDSFIAPTPATRRTSFFADRRVFAYSNGTSATSLHYGIDYGIPTGSEIKACADGKVVMAEDRITTGFSTVIEHLPGLYSIYYHQSKLNCKEGDFVKKGDLIGYSGATGLATGPHLHWEIRLNMEAVSPDFFLGDFTFEKSLDSL